jgi:hypothetical protein
LNVNLAKELRNKHTTYAYYPELPKLMQGEEALSEFLKIKLLPLTVFAVFFGLIFINYIDISVTLL